MKAIRGGMTGLIQPELTVGAAGLDDERVSFPLTNRESLPRRPVHNLRQRTAVGEYLPKCRTGSMSIPESGRSLAESQALLLGLSPWAGNGRWGHLSSCWPGVHRIPPWPTAGKERNLRL